MVMSKINLQIAKHITELSQLTSDPVVMRHLELYIYIVFIAELPLYAYFHASFNFQFALHHQ